MASAVDASSNDPPDLDPGAPDLPGRMPQGRLRKIAGRAWLWVRAGNIPDGWVFAASYLLLLPFFLAPLFATRLLPGLDLGFHLAAADLLAKTGAASSPYAAYYQGGLRVAPYAAHFAALVGLGKVMSLLTAHKVIIGLYVAGLPLAMASLMAACRRSRIPALLAFPLAYNLTLHYGFVSFALSLPVVLLLLGQMTLLSRSQERIGVWSRWLVTALAALLLFLCHLQNYLYGVCAALAFALFSSAPFRRRLFAAAALLPSLAGLAYWHVSSPPVAGQGKVTLATVWALLKQHRLFDKGRHTLLEDLWDRIYYFPHQPMRAFSDMVEVPACQALLLLVAAYMLIGLLAWQGSGELAETQVERGQRMRFACLISFVGALAAYLGLPHHLPEMELMTFFPRFAILVLLMLLLLVPAGLLRFRGLLRVLLPVPAVVLCALYGHQLLVHYRHYGEEVADFVAVAEQTPPGGKALGLVFSRASRVMRIESALLALPGFYPALRPAPGSMAVAQYCGMRHMPCRLKVSPEFATDPWSPGAFKPAAMLPTFDYYFVRSLPPGYDLFKGYSRMVELVAKAGTWMVFRKKPGPLLHDVVLPVTPAVPAPKAIVPRM